MKINSSFRHCQKPAFTQRSYWKIHALFHVTYKMLLYTHFFFYSNHYHRCYRKGSDINRKMWQVWLFWEVSLSTGLRHFGVRDEYKPQAFNCCKVNRNRAKRRSEGSPMYHVVQSPVQRRVPLKMRLHCKELPLTFKWNFCSYSTRSWPPVLWLRASATHSSKSAFWGIPHIPLLPTVLYVLLAECINTAVKRWGFLQSIYYGTVFLLPTLQKGMQLRALQRRSGKNHWVLSESQNMKKDDWVPEISAWHQTPQISFFLC